MSEEIASRSFSGMKSRRRATLVALAREREAKHVAMLEGCAEMMPKPRVFPAEERQSNNCCEDETPFDERRCLTDDLGFDEDIPMQPCRGRRGPIPPATSRGKFDMYSTNHTRSTYHRQQSKSLPMDVRAEKNIRDFDCINFSPLVRHRENQQRTLKRDIELGDESAEQPSIPRTKSWGFIGDSSLDNPIHCRRKEKEWEDTEKKGTSSSPKGINTKRLQRQLLRGRHDKDTGKYNPTENEKSLTRQDASASIDIPPSRKSGATSPQCKISMVQSLQPKQSNDCHDLPSDEECNNDVQSLPSIDGDCLGLETKESITEAQDVDSGPTGADSEHLMPETSLAVEISRFKLLKSIHELQPCDTISTATTSTSSDSKRQVAPQFKEEEDSRFRRFALASSVSIMTSEKRMRSAMIYRKAGSPKLPFRRQINSQFDSMPSREVMMIPINTTLSSLDGSVSTEGSNTEKFHAMENHENKPIIRATSKTTSCPILEPRLALQPASQQPEVSRNVQTGSNANATPNEEPMETKKSKWSFYNPKEIEALAGEIIVGESDKAAEKPSEDNVQPANEKSNETEVQKLPHIQSPTPSIVEDPSCNISIDSDFSFSHLHMENDSSDAEKEEEARDECISIGSQCNSDPSDELTIHIPADTLVDESSDHGNSQKQETDYDGVQDSPDMQEAISSENNGIDVPMLSIDSGIDETESIVSEEGPLINITQPRKPVRVNLDQYRQTSILQENSLHCAVDAIKSSGTSDHPFGESRNSFLAETFEEASFENALIRQQRAGRKEAVVSMGGMTTSCLCMERPSPVQKVTHTVQIPPVNPAIVLSSPAIPPLEQTLFLDRYSSAEEKSECHLHRGFEGYDKYDLERRPPTESLGCANDTREDSDEVLQALISKGDPSMDAGSTNGGDDLDPIMDGSVEGIDEDKLHSEPMGKYKSDVSKYLKAPLNSIARSMESVEDDSTARSDVTSSTTSSDTGSYSSRTKSTLARDAQPLDMPDPQELNMYSFDSTNCDSILKFEPEDRMERVKLAGTDLVLAPNRRLVPYDEDVCGPKTREMVRLLARGRRPFEAQDVLWSQRFFCKCAAVSFDDEHFGQKYF